MVWNSAAESPFGTYRHGSCLNYSQAGDLNFKGFAIPERILPEIHSDSPVLVRNNGSVFTMRLMVELDAGRAG